MTKKLSHHQRRYLTAYGEMARRLHEAELGVRPSSEILTLRCPPLGAWGARNRAQNVISNALNARPWRHQKYVRFTIPQKAQIDAVLDAFGC
jgi:hypothetical protein